MVPYLRKWETFVAPRDGHDPILDHEIVRSAHGTAGPIQVSVANFQYASDQLILQAAAQSNVPYSQS